MSGLSMLATTGRLALLIFLPFLLILLIFLLFLLILLLALGTLIFPRRVNRSIRPAGCLLGSSCVSGNLSITGAPNSYSIRST